MTALIPFIRRNTLHDWVYDFDQLLESHAGENLTLSGDIDETETYILMSFDFPGMKEGDFHVKVEGDKLTIAGERKREGSEGSTRSYGRQYGKFYKVFIIPKNIDRAEIEADYRDGVLRIALPKAPREKEQAINIQIGNQSEGFFSSGSKDQTPKPL